jgi:hypothetical protein
LILYTTTDSYIIVTLTPVVWQGNKKTLNSFCEKEKVQIGALPHHLPSFQPPRISFRQKEIAAKASVNILTTFYYILGYLLTWHIDGLDRFAEAICFNNTVLSISLGVKTVIIAIPTTCAYRVTTAPWLP